MKVKDKVCVVTGAAGGIGEAIARRFAKEGAKGVVVADHDKARVETVAKDIKGIAVACDVGKEADVRYDNPLAGEVTRYVADISKARDLLEYAPETPLALGIRKYVAWCRETGFI